MTMEESMTALVDAVARHNVSNADRISAIVDGGRALLDIQAKLEHGEFGGMLEHVGLPRNTAYRWVKVAKTGLDADYIAREYGSVTELLKDREATSGRLADMILKLVVANEACEEHKALIAELKTELAAMVAENPSIAARMSVAEERETVISQNTHKAAYTEAHDALYPHVPINVPPPDTGYRFKPSLRYGSGRNMDKRSAMEMVNEHLGNRLLYGRNTSFANISGPASLWWMTIDPSKFKSDLHLLLAKEGDGGLIWLRIKGNAFPDVSKVFRVRQDNSHKGWIDWEISSRPPKYITDVKSGGTEYDFTKHIEHEWGRPCWTAPGT